VDGVRRDYKITYGRYGSNVARGFAYAGASASDGREADAERLAAVIKALTGKEPWIRRMKGGTIMIVLRQRAPRRLQALYRTRRRHREVARRDGPMNALGITFSFRSHG
jgi:hypothetical protein